MEIKPWLTAIHRKNISAPLKKILDLNILDFNQEILDYGCGHGYDLTYLQKLGYKATGYDKFIKTHSNDDYQKYTYDIIYCFYVLNTIEDEKERIEAISNIIKSLNKNGQAYIAIRSIEELNSQKKDSYIKYKDGIITKKSTFQKYFTQEYLEELIYSNFTNITLEHIKFNKNTLFIKLFK